WVPARLLTTGIDNSSFVIGDSDGHLLNNDGLFRPVAFGEFGVISHRLCKYSTHHVQTARHLAENREAAVHHRRLSQGNVELAAGGVRVLPMAGAQRPLLLVRIRAALPLLPIAAASP